MARRGATRSGPAKRNAWRSLTQRAGLTRSLPSEVRELVELLLQDGCEFLVVGAHALAVHGAPMYQLGLPPRRIDLLNLVSGLTFDEAWSSRVYAVVDGVHLPVLGLAALVKNKRATGRTKDLLDIELLREAGRSVDE